MIEGLTKVFFPEASNTVIFVIMAIVLLVRPAGLFGRRALMERVVDPLAKKPSALRAQSETIAFVVMVAALVVAPFVTYPLFLMQVLCFALFACAFNLLIGYVGLLSFGHALYFGWASYRRRRYAAKVWGLHAGTRDPHRHRDRRRAAVSSPARWRSAGRASISP